MKTKMMLKAGLISAVAILSLMAFTGVAYAADEPLIIDHNDTDLRALSQTAIQHAKDNLHIAYGRTSHGGQLTEGERGNAGTGAALLAFINGGGLGLTALDPAYSNLFIFNNGGTGGALDLHDKFPDELGEGYIDLGQHHWPTVTRNYLNNPVNSDVNVIIWSWCGQVNDEYTTIHEPTQNNWLYHYYLRAMNELEAEYPNITFVYMTGHLNGTGPTGDLHLGNQQIRDYCVANNKVLYDFADIESYDPGGIINYMELNANAGCYYDSDGDGIVDSSNWAIDWQNSHSVGVDWYNCPAAHTKPLNANRKAYAMWALWTKIAARMGDLPLAITTSSLPNGEVGQNYSKILEASGGTPPYTWAIAQGSSLPADLILEPNDTISGTPDITAVGTTDVTVEVTDSTNPSPQTHSVTLSITISDSPVNQAPVAADDGPFETSEELPLTIYIDSDIVDNDLLDNDTDADGTIDRSSFVITSGPARGACSEPVNGETIYTPETNFFGSDSFTYTVNDDDGATSNQATVSITVNPADVNHAPVIHPIAGGLTQLFEAESAELGGEILLDGEMQIKSEVPGSLESQYIIYASHENPDEPGPGEASYPVPIAEAGDYKIWCRVFAQSAGEDSFFVSIADSRGNTIYENTEYDIAGEPVQLGEWLWTPVTYRVYEDDRFTGVEPRIFNLSAAEYTVIFKGREQNSILDRIIITNEMDFTPNDDFEPRDLTVEEGDTLEITVIAEDDDGDDLTFDIICSDPSCDFAAITSADDPLTPEKEALLTLTPAANQEGVYYLTIQVTDGNEGYDTIIITITVIPAIITPGDVDGVGGITILDAILTARIAGGLVEGMQPWQLAAADIDGGGVTMRDAVLIAQMALESE